MSDVPTQRIKKRKLTPRKPKPQPLPDGPWITREPHGKSELITFTDNGITAIRLIAANGGSLGLISSRANITKSALKKAMDHDERGRIAFEAGIAEEEAELVQSLRLKAVKGLSAVPELFLLKTRHGFVEGAPPASTAPNIIIQLPDAHSPESYMRLIGGSAPENPRGLVRKIAADDDGGTVR